MPSDPVDCCVNTFYSLSGFPVYDGRKEMTLNILQWLDISYPYGFCISIVFLFCTGTHVPSWRL